MQYYLFTNPCAKESRKIHGALAFAKMPLNIILRMTTADDMGFHISTLPTFIITDDSGAEIFREEDVTKMTVKDAYKQYRKWSGVDVVDAVDQTS